MGNNNAATRCAILLVAAVPLVKAAEWSVTPSAAIRMELDDNKRLTLADHNAVIGNVSEGGLTFERRTERIRMSFTPSGRIQRFSDNGDGVELDSDDVFANLTTALTGERYLAQLGVNYSRQSSISTELDESGRVINVNVPVNNISVGPSFSYLTSERNTVQVSFGYADKFYENAENTGLIGYNNLSASVSDTYRLSETDDVFGTFFVSRFDPDEIEGIIRRDSVTDNLGFQGGMAVAFTETFNVSAALGWQYSFTDTEFDLFGSTSEIESDTSGILANVSAQKQFERTTWNTLYSRAVSGTSEGQQNTQDRFNVNVRRNFLERLDGTVSYGFATNQRQLDTTGSTKNVITTVNAGLSYRLSPYWTLGGSYRYRLRSTETTEEDAESNALFFTLNYQDYKWAISR